jgi:hypothetical protein
MIEKINNYDKIIAKKGTSSGKTLDMSGGKRKRNYTSRRNIDSAGKITPSKQSYPPYVTDYAKFIGSLRQVQAIELEKEQKCYLHV